MLKKYLLLLSLGFNILLLLMLANTEFISDEFIDSHYWKVNSPDMTDYCPQFGDIFAYYRLKNSLLYDKKNRVVGVIKATAPRYSNRLYHLVGHVNIGVYDIEFNKSCYYLAKGKSKRRKRD